MARGYRLQVTGDGGEFGTWNLELGIWNTGARRQVSPSGQNRSVSASKECEMRNANCRAALPILMFLGKVADKGLVPGMLSACAEHLAASI